MQKLNNANQQYDILKADYDELDAHTKEIQARLDELTTGNTSVIAQYQGLIGFSRITGAVIWWQRPRHLQEQALI